MVDGQRNVGGGGLADRLAVVPGLGQGQKVEVLRHAVGDGVESIGPLGGGRLAPGLLGRVGRVQGAFDVRGVGSGDLAQGLAVDGGGIVEIAARGRLDELSADIVAIARLVGRRARGDPFGLVHVGRSLGCRLADLGASDAPRGARVNKQR